MAEVVAGIATSHAPFLSIPSMFEAIEEGQRSRVVAGLEKARGILQRARPDAIVIFSTDHFDRCFYDKLPPFLVGNYILKSHGGMTPLPLRYPHPEFPEQSLVA